MTQGCIVTGEDMVLPNGKEKDLRFPCSQTPPPVASHASTRSRATGLATGI